MKESGRLGQNISISQIMTQFWNGVRPMKNWFVFSYVFFFCAQIVNVIVPLYYKDVFDILGKSTDPVSVVSDLNRVIFIILFLHLGNQLFWQAGTYFFTKMQSSVMARLKQNAFTYMIEHSYTFFANNFSGSLVQRVGRFSRAFEALTDSVAFNMMPLTITIIGSIWITWSVAPVISVILGVWVVIFVVFSVVFSTWKLKYDTAVAEADSRTTGYLADSITNNNAISFFTGHKHESLGFQGVSNDQAQKILFSWRLGNVVDAIQILLISVVEFFVFYFAIRYWSLGLITIGTFVLAQTYIIGVANQLWGLNKIIRNIYQSIADSKEMVDILLTKHEIKNIPHAKKLVVTRGEIVFDSISFAFGENNKVLHNITLTIKPGEKVAIIGPSGAGKTTLVRLIMRLYNLTKGSIRIDSQDISLVSQESLRENISFVPQDPVLFHRTLIENIRYGRRDATDEEVKEAACLAHCDEFIDTLPLKYETFVGERGIKLSGGERQRVAIARAILKKAPILIFDEATSSLDSYSESLIQGALENLMKDCTTIVIAHRLSTVKKMDRIIVMGNGSVVEDGTHDELSNKDSGLYKKLWDLQVSGFMEKNQ
ncbi:MAG: ABC transporter ATP-binding protein/permease [Candidatus Campbellbacteria bacterium]|nr:ABC transporter ATP-binding protein/permease [Candidatus Campbellbacteria bacterium]